MSQKHFLGIFFASITLAVLAWFQASASHVSQGAVDAAVSGWNYYAPISRKINLNARPDMVSAVLDSSDNVRYSHSDGQTFTADWFGFSATVCSMASQIAEATKDYSHTAEACSGGGGGASVAVPPLTVNPSALQCGQEISVTPLDTGGANVAISGNYAYLAGNYVFRVIDLSNSSRPVEKGRVAVATYGPISGVVDYVFPDPYGKGSLGVYVSGSRAYVRDHVGISVIDITTPNNPQVLWQLFLGGNITAGQSLDIVADNNYIYTAGGDGVFVVDITQKKLVGSASGTRALTLHNNLLYAIRHDAGVPYAMLSGWDFSNPSSPKLAGGNYSLYGREGANMAIAGNYLFDPGEFTVLDLSNQSGGTVEIKRIFTNSALGGQYISISSSRAYVADSDKLKIIDITDPRNPTLIRSLTVAGNITGLEVIGSTGFVSSGGALRIVDFSNCPSVSSSAVVSNNMTAGQMQAQGIFPNTFYINDRNYFLIQGVNFNQPVLTTSNPAVTFSEVVVTAGGHSITGVANIGNTSTGALKILVKDGEAQAELAVGLLKRPAGGPQIEQISFGDFVQNYMPFVITGTNLSRVNKIEFAGLGEAKVEIESTSDIEIRGKLYIFGYSTETPESAVPQAVFSPDNGTLIVDRDAWTFSLISANPGDVLSVEAWKDGVYMDRYTICTVPANQKSCSAARIPTKIDLGVWTEQIYINDKPSGSLKVTVAEAPSQAVAASSVLPALPALPTKTSYRFSRLPSGAYRDGPHFLYKDFVIVANYFGTGRANVQVRLTDDMGLNYAYTKDNLNVPLFIDGGNAKKTILLNIAGNAFPVNDQRAEYHPAVNVEITADKPIYVLPPEQFATEGRGLTVLEATENAWQAFGFTPPRFQEQDSIVVPYAIFWRNLSVFPDGWDTKITLTNRLDQKAETQLSYYPDYYKVHDPDTCQAIDAGDGTAVAKNIALQAGETKLFYLSSILGVSWNSSYQTEGALSFKFPGGDGGNVEVKAEVVPLSNGRRICSEPQANNFLRERQNSSLSAVLALSASAAGEDGMVSGIGQVCNEVGCDAAKADLASSILITSKGITVGASSKVTSSSFSWQVTNPFKGGVDSVMGLLAVLANFIFQLGIPVAVIIIIYSGVTYLTAGTSDRVKRGTNGLKYAALGLAILLIGKGFVALIQSILNVR